MSTAAPRDRMARARATVDGLEVRWSSAGSGSPTIVFVHGAVGDERYWQPQVVGLVADYRVITLDLPGHGRSDAPADGVFSIEIFAHAVEAVRAAAGADRVVVVGHSLGSAVAIRYAQRFPEHTAGLVIVDDLETPDNDPVARSSDHVDTPVLGVHSIENPEEFNRALVEFLETLPA